MEKSKYKKVETGNVVKLDVESPSIEGKFISIEESQMFEHSWALKFNDIELTNEINKGFYSKNYKVIDGLIYNNDKLTDLELYKKKDRILLITMVK